MNYKVFYLDCLVFYAFIEKALSLDPVPAASKLDLNNDLLLDPEDYQYDDTGWIHFNDMENYDLKKPDK